MASHLVSSPRSPRPSGLTQLVTAQGRYHPARVGSLPPPTTTTASTCYASSGMPLAFKQKDLLVTARIRSMTGRYRFHRCLSVNISEGGYSIQVWMVGGGGTPSQVWGVPCPGLDGGEVPYSRSGVKGVPLPGLDGVPNPRGYQGYPLTRSGWGVPQLGLDNGGYFGYPQLGLDGGTPSWGVPHLNGWGTPSQGGTPVRFWQRGYPPG